DLRRSSIAFSISPAASTSAFLHSIMPRPVRSRSSFTREAVTSAIDHSSMIVWLEKRGHSPLLSSARLVPESSRAVWVSSKPRSALRAAVGASQRLARQRFSNSLSGLFGYAFTGRGLVHFDEFVPGGHGVALALAFEHRVRGGGQI